MSPSTKVTGFAGDPLDRLRDSGSVGEVVQYYDLLPGTKARARVWEPM